MDKSFFTALSFSFLFNFLMWFVFSPVIVFSPVEKANSRLAYLGTILVGKLECYSSRPSNFLQKGMICQILRVGKVSSLFRKDIYEQRLGDRFLELLMPDFRFKRKQLFLSSPDRANHKYQKKLEIFSRGQVSLFPNGKRYGFVPTYLYPNVYRMILISRYVERGYE